jgi:uncharacterized protein (DUF488 family)
MGTKHTILATIGYEAAELDDFVATLLAAGIKRLIDIRELPISRRRGFAKRALSEALADVGIAYVHLRGLGDPKEGRDAARAGDVSQFKRVFTRHMHSNIAQDDLRIASRLVEEGGACLMCYERDHVACHRTIVAEAISSSVAVRIRHLGVRAGLGRHHQQNGQLELVEART